MVISLQANRKSNEVFETLALQVSCIIQTSFPKTYAYHQYDTVLLSRIEPIIFSFLSHANKSSLKQKTLQAWNNTFGIYLYL